ncbi:MAG TPA: GAF domain-containing protein, partial [Firmicutes bacterium]|nr:GAF domain-containing protein [Bacillota bacterium]
MAETSNPKELTDLQKLLKSIESLFASPELELILTRIIGLAREVLQADYASIALVDEKGSLTKSVEDFTKVIPLERRARPEGLTMQIIGTKEPVLVHNVETNHRSSNPVLIELGIKSYVGVPLIVDGRVRGVLYAHSLRPRAFARKLSLITAFAGYAAVALKNALLVEELKTQAIRDSLSLLYNHRYFYERLDEEIRRCKRSHQ